jgi:hypothetical protein
MNIDEPLPSAVLDVVELLDGLSGARAVALGGSRASGMVDAGSDWDLTVYYRGGLDIQPLAALGTVHPPGSWGRIMNGGAWLQLGGLKIDVMLRDLDSVQHWSACAQQGRFEVDALLGDLAGRPTYSLLAEWAVGRVLRGSLPVAPEYPAALAASAPVRWRSSRDFNLAVAAMHSGRANVAGAVGLAARALMEEAHARMSEQRRWTLNEKRLVAEVGLTAVQTRFSHVPDSAPQLSPWLASLAEALGSSANPPGPA